MNHFSDNDLIDYLHHEVSDAVDARIHAHLAACRYCSDRCDAEAAVGEMLRSSALAQEREFPSLVGARVWAAIHAAEPSWPERVRAAFRPILAVPLAAALAVLLYLGIPIVRGDYAASSPTVAAAYYFEEHAAQGLENPLADHNSTSAILTSGRAGATTGGPLIDAADAATLDDLAASQE